MIRKATLDDIQSIYKVFAEARAFMRSYGNDVQWTGRYPEERIEGDIKNGVLYVFDTGNEIAAVFAIIPGEDPTYKVIEDGEWKNSLPYATIHRIGVSASARGTGIAKQCVDFCFSMYGNVRVDTYKTNEPMQKFLKKNGFEKCGTIYVEDHSPRVALQKTADLVLASQSPRRKQLMKLLGKEFCICVSDVEETVPENITSEQTAEYLSGLKAEDVFKKTGKNDITIIGSDTVVDVDGVILGKPKDREDALRMLKTLSGRSHFVRTGVTIIKNHRDKEPERQSFTSVTKVTFFDLTDNEINAYIDTGKPMDKAGAYGIQDGSELFVKSIEGDYFTVVGFPIGEIARRL